MKLSRSTRLAAALAAGSLALAACGGSDSGDGASAAEGEGLSGTLAGAGSSAQGAAMEGWIAGFQTANEGVTVNYDPVGSGGGREQFLSGGVDFAGSDAYLDDEELAKAKDRSVQSRLSMHRRLAVGLRDRRDSERLRRRRHDDATRCIHRYAAAGGGHRGDADRAREARPLTANDPRGARVARHDSRS